MLCVVGLKRNRSLQTATTQFNDSNLYCQQRLRQAIEKERPELINREDVFRHDNARLHTSLMTKIERTWLGSFASIL